ncbi:MAG: hypothetical protein ACLRVN_03885 [Butyricicoccus sp.]
MAAVTAIVLGSRKIQRGKPSGWTRQACTAGADVKENNLTRFSGVTIYDGVVIGDTAYYA